MLKFRRMLSVAALICAVCTSVAIYSCDTGGGGDNDSGFDAGSDSGGAKDTGVQDSGVMDSGFDAGEDDAGTDTGVKDTGIPDAGVKDAGPDASQDANIPDGNIPDSGPDASVPDGGVPDAGPDAGPDGGIHDSGTPDAGPDGGSYPCSPNCPVVDMVNISAGTFHMGCNETVDSDCYSEESPYHDVTLSAYAIDKYETKAVDYKSCVLHGGCTAALTSSGCTYNAGGDYPINCVEWAQAKAYCTWVGKRLPTEAEWEMAARGTDGIKYPWGNTPDASCNHAVMDDGDVGGTGCGTGGAMAIGSKTAGVSPCGAMDMIGNVWEWVNDWYASDYYSSSPSNDPKGPSNGSYRVLRGGSWNDDSISYLRASTRNSDIPTKAFSDYGFRCAK